jgi:putative ABC transport system substrate-binding protein
MLASTRARRAFAAMAVIAAAAALAPLIDPAAVPAQPAGKVNRIGHLSGRSQAGTRALLEAFRAGLRDLGYVEGRHFVLDTRYAEGKVDRLPALAQELLQARPDVLLVATTPGTLAAKAATSTVPIVMVLVADPIGAGIVPSLARPGGNITGVTNIVAELAGKRLEILKELLPGASRIAVLVNPNSQNAPLQLRSAEDAARRLGVEIHPVLEVRSAADLERAFEGAVRAHAAAAIRMIDPLVFMLRQETAALAVRHRLPVIYPTREDVEAGGLVAYGANVPQQFRQAAGLVDRILRGAKPADLPIEQPTRFDLVFNLKAARALHLVVPPALLHRADHLIE